MDFFYLLMILNKRKWIILSATILALVVTYLLTRNKPKVYKSSTQISTGFTVRDEVRVSDDNVSFFGADIKFNNTLISLKSEPVISLVSYKLILHDIEEKEPFVDFSINNAQIPQIYTELIKEKPRLISKFRDKLETMDVLSSFDPYEKKMIELLRTLGYDYQSLSRNLLIFRLQRTDYIQIDYNSLNPQLSAFVVNNLYNEFIRYYTKVKNTKSMESTDTLKSIMDKKKQELDLKRAILTGEGIITTEIENTNSLDRITTLEKSLVDEKTKQLNLIYSLRKINQRIGDGTQKQPGNDTNININSEILTLRIAMNKAYEDYINSGSKDQKLFDKYSQIKNEYQQKVANYSNVKEDNAKPTQKKEELQLEKADLEFDLQATDENIKAIQQRIDALKGGFLQDAAKASNIETLMKDVEIANKEYIDAKQKYTDAIDITTSSVNNFRQILKGQPAIDPEPSKRLMILGMSGLTTAIVTSLIIVLVAFLDSSLKTPNNYMKAVGLKLISVVNFTDLKHKTIYEYLFNEISNKKNKNQRDNSFREAIRKLRYEIENSGKKIFLFTSTSKGLGKTTLIQAVAYSFSLSNKKILIIDTNFCNNDLTLQFNAEPVLELFHYDKVTTPDMINKIREFSKEVDGKSIFVLGSESGDFTPSELFERGNILDQLAELKSEYDYIFLEGPPLNDFTDSKELSKYVEGVIAIFSADQIVRQVDKEAIEFLKDLGDKFTGSVLNKVKMENLNLG